MNKKLVLLILLLSVGTVFGQPDYKRFIFRPVEKEQSFLQQFLKAKNKTPMTARYAIVIAISEYEQMPRLKTVASDGQKMKSFLLTVERYDEVVVLTDADANFDNIRYFMESYFPKKMAKEGRYQFLFYFSGHGGQQPGYDDQPQGFLQLQKATGLVGDENIVHMGQIEQWANRLRYAKQALFLLDCCFSGLAGVEQKKYDTSLDPDELAAENGRYMITAGDADQTAIAGDQWNGSLFTDVAIYGMNGGADDNDDGVVTTYELFSFVDGAVKSEAKKKNHLQTPRLNNMGGYQDRGQYFFVYRPPDGSDAKPDEHGGFVEKKETEPQKITTEAVTTNEYTDPKTGIEFVRIPGGSFDMGSNDGESDEKPVHKVTLKDFYLAKTEVTVGQFKKFVQAKNHRTDAEKEGWSYAWSGTEWKKVDGASWRKPGFDQTDSQPVVCVSWNDAKAFCDWAGLRLPSEAEWEYAARCGPKQYKYSWGNSAPSGRKGGNVADETSKRKFNWSPIFDGYDDFYAFTAPVSSFDPNDFGLYDMTGNVWEWCADWYQNSYEGAPKDGSAWIGGVKNTQSRVLRGGSFSDFPIYARAANRLNGPPDNRSFNIGFRVVRGF